MKYKVIERMEYELVYEVEAESAEHAESIYLDSVFPSVTNEELIEILVEEGVDEED